MKVKKVIPIPLLALLSFTCIAQEFGESDLAITLSTADCTTSCGLKVAYNSRVTIENDTIRIYLPQDDSQQIAGEYLILKSKEKWKVPNYSGYGKFRALYLSDTLKSKYLITLNLMKGTGTMNFFHAQSCELSFEVSNISEKNQNDATVVQRNR